MSKAVWRLDRGFVYLNNIALFHSADVKAMPSATTRAAIAAQLARNSHSLDKVLLKTSTANYMKYGDALDTATRSQIDAVAT